MPAPGNLTPPALTKAALCARIAAQREDLVIAAHGVMRPLEFLDRCHELWRRLPPLVKVGGSALVALVAGRCLRSPGWRATLLRWTPAILGALRR